MKRETQSYDSRGELTLEEKYGNISLKGRRSTSRADRDEAHQTHPMVESSDYSAEESHAHSQPSKVYSPVVRKKN